MAWHDKGSPLPSPETTWGGTAKLAAQVQQEARLQTRGGLQGGARAAQALSPTAPPTSRDTSKSLDGRGSNYFIKDLEMMSNSIWGQNALLTESLLPLA